MGRCASGCVGGEEPARGSGTDRLAEDERLARYARQRPHRAAVDVYRSATRRVGALTRDRASRTAARNFQMVEGRASWRLPRLQSERQGSHHLLGVLDPSASRRAGIGAPALGRSRRLGARRFHGADNAAALDRDRRPQQRHGPGARLTGSTARFGRPRRGRRTR